MADSSLDNLAMGSSLSGASSPLSLSSGASSSIGSLGNLGSIGALAGGAAGLGWAILAQGEGSLPSQFQQLQAGVPGLQQTGSALTSQGQALQAQGMQAVGMAQQGQLTAPQQAQLSQYGAGLNNQSRQMFYNMGRNPDADTAAINQSGNNAAMVNAMAQQDIQSTLQIGLGELSAGATSIGQGLQFDQAANQALLAAGEAQLKLDQQYSTSLTSAFSSIGNLFGAAVKAAPALAAL